MASAALSSEVDRQAARWLTLLELGAPTAAERRGFEAWIAADPAHRTAYDTLADIWRDSAELAELAALEPVAPPRPRGALAAFVDGIRQAALPIRAAAAAGLAAVVIATAVLLLQASSDTPGHYATQVAEIREVALADGSQVTLGPKSTLDVAFTEQERRVVLATGEAFFSVVGNPARPFVVVADGTMVRVVGTQFNVHRGPEGVTVAVVEGAVEITKPEPPRGAAPDRTPEAAPRRLTAGEQLVLGPARAAAIERVLPSRPGAWRAGRLIYENSSLRQVVADANRYSATPIVIAAAELEDLPVFATFRTSQIAAMIQGLEDNLPIAVDRTLPDRIVLRPGPDQDASP